MGHSATEFTFTGCVQFVVVTTHYIFLLGAYSYALHPIEHELIIITDLVFICYLIELHSSLLALPNEWQCNYE